MSRLIFEGDTTERFGRYFPKPFIQEIKVFDNNVQTDIALYFEIEEDVEVADFISDTGLEKLRLFTGPIHGNPLENTSILSRGIGFVFSSMDIERQVVNDGRQPDAFSTYALTDFESTAQFFYNSEGVKFVRFMITDTTWENYDFGDNVEKYIIALTFFDNVDITDQDATATSVAQNYNLFSEQTSEISFEKVFNSDGTLNSGRQTIFRETDGNAYSGIPLRALDNTFRKTSNITHQRIVNLINPIVSSYIGIVPEAEQVSLTLAQNANDPSLLTEIKKTINSFSNKSTATTTGQFFSQLVEAVSDVDNLLQAEDLLDNRLEPNLKIKDNRLFSIPANIDFLDATNTSFLQDNDTTEAMYSYFPQPFVYRSLESAVPLSDFTSQDDALISGKVYFFFDYEKALNYKPLISYIFNPYAIQQLYGRNSLNKFFKIQNVQCEFRQPSNLNQTLNFFPEIFSELGEIELNASIISEEPSNNYISNDKKIYNGDESYTFKTKFCERAFDTATGLNGYRLKTYELDYLKPYDYINYDERLKFSVTISDTSMQFYETHIRSKMFDLNSKLQEYLSFAEQFCSYNNIDNRFNDFFNEQIIEQFEEPYPWDEAPLFYYSLLSLVLNSWNVTGVDGDTPSLASRKLDGEILNFEGIRQSALTKIQQISPTSGDLQSLSDFAASFSAYYDQFIGVGGQFDTSVGVAGADIYTDVGGNPTLVTPQRELVLAPSSLFTSNTTVDIDLKIVNPDASGLDYKKPNRSQPGTNFESIDYSEMVGYIKNYLLYEPQLEVDFRIILQDANAETSEEIRSGTKPLIDFYNNNVMEGNENYYISETTLEQIQTRLYPLVYDFILLVQTAFGDEVRNFQNSSTPEIYWKNNYHLIEESADRFLQNNPERHIFKYNRTDDSKAIEQYFQINRDSLLTYMGVLAINYWTYSYYYGDGESEDGVFANPITLSQFLKAIGVHNENVPQDSVNVDA